LAQASLKSGVYIEGSRQKSIDVQLKEFDQALEKYAEGVGHAAPVIQNRLANLCADLYMRFLRKGVGQENTSLTSAVRGGTTPPLAGLADHVVVEYASIEETGDGQFIEPALIKFDSDEWARIALLHDRGYAIVPTKNQRKYLFAAAQANGYSPSYIFENDMGAGGSGFWLVPARPHVWYLSSEDINEEVRAELDTWERSKMGWNALRVRTSRPVKGNFIPNHRRATSIDTIQIADMLSDEGGDE
jgi:hypothetical protein